MTEVEYYFVVIIAIVVLMSMIFGCLELSDRIFHRHASC